MDNNSVRLKQFSEMPLKPELLSAIRGIGFTTPTEVQEQALPVALSGKDVIVRAKTGTGKTAVFIVSIMQNMQRTNAVSALVIVPTRELALQVAHFSESLGRSLHIRTAIVYGGASMNVQVSALRAGVDIVVGTPGRIIDLMERGVLRLEHVKFAVLDEGDRMLDMGFIDDVDYILSKTPQSRQTMLFSATMPEAIIKVARHHMKDDFVTMSIGGDENMVVETILHGYAFANGRMKFNALLAYIDQVSPKKCIIFLNTQREAELVHRVLVERGFNAILMHGGLTQARREYSLHSFKEGARFLIATNIAARGLDIEDVTDIINFDAPDTPENYVHRVGRSARMGKAGRAFTILSYDDRWLLGAIQNEMNIRMEEVHLNLDKYNDFALPTRGRDRFGRREHVGRRTESWNRNRHDTAHRFERPSRGGGGDNRNRRRYSPYNNA
jgi:ATP-dependent RNA helicase DeaD